MGGVAPYNEFVTDVAVKSDYASLVKAAKTGDRDAMEQLLVRAQEAAYRFSLLVCGHLEDAEDVMQDALLKTYHHVGHISEPGAFRTWLSTTVTNMSDEAAPARGGTGELRIGGAGRQGGDGGTAVDIAGAGP